MCDDGQQRRCAMAISAASPNSSQSQVYVPNADGSNPQLITRGAELFSWLATRRQVSGHRRATRRQAIR